VAGVKGVAVKRTGRKVFVVEYDEPNVLGKRDTQVFLLPVNADEEFRRAKKLDLNPVVRKETYSYGDHGVPADMPKGLAWRR
jgi:hypothetical protein